MPFKLIWLTVLLVSLVCKSQKFENVNFPQIIEHQTPDFYHTFTVKPVLSGHRIKRTPSIKRTVAEVPKSLIFCK